MEFTGKVHGLFYPHVCKALVTLLLAARKVLYSFVSFQAVQTLLPPFPPVRLRRGQAEDVCRGQEEAAAVLLEGPGVLRAPGETTARLSPEENPGCL